MIFPTKSGDAEIPSEEQEITTAAKALRYRVYNRADKDDEQELAFLTDVTKTVLREKWKLSKNSALIEVLGLAVGQLPDKEFPAGFDKSWRWIGEVLYGYASQHELQELQNQPYAYNSRRAFVKRLYDEARPTSSPKKTFERNIIWPIRATLVSILKGLEQEGPKEATSDDSGDTRLISLSPSEGGTVDPHYVPRIDLHQRFNQLVTEPDTSVIAFVGFPGMGKTWLATALARLDDGSQAPVIRVVSGKISVPDLQIACQRFGINADSAIFPDLSACLTLLLCEASAPKLVVLDDLESTDELRELLPRTGIKSIVVATARRRGEFSKAGWRFIDVRKMNDTEAVDLVRRQAPQLSQGDALLLAKSFAGYPLAISYACRLAVEQDCPVSDFCDDLKAHASNIAGHLSTDEGSTLLAILRQALAFVADRDPNRPPINNGFFLELDSRGYVNMLPGTIPARLWRCNTSRWFTRSAPDRRCSAHRRLVATTTETRRGY